MIESLWSSDAEMKIVIVVSFFNFITLTKTVRNTTILQKVLLKKKVKSNAFLANFSQSLKIILSVQHQKQINLLNKITRKTLDI